MFEIDSNNLGLTIDYYITDWYIDDDLYIQKSLIYNSVSIFSLNENITKEKFNEYVENKMNDNELVETIYQKIFEK